MTEKNLSELFVDTSKDIYYAEKQIYKSLPTMAKAANSDQLRAAFEPSRTLPITSALPATKYRPSAGNCGERPSSS